MRASGLTNHPISPSISPRSARTPLSGGAPARSPQDPRAGSPPATRARARHGARTRSWLAELCLLAALASAAPGCGTPESAPPQLPLGPLELARIDWSQALPALAGPGRVTTVAEAGDDVAVFGERGVFLWQSGSTAGSDSSILTWRSAAAVPALGFPGKWLLAVDGDGRVYRLHDGAAFGLEEVTARYALTARPVREVAALGNGQVAFALDDRLALTDGTTLKLYELALRNLVGGGGRLASYDEAGVRLLDPQSGALQALTVPGVVGVAFAPDGQLWAATADTLYYEKAGAFVAAHTFAPPQVVTALAGAARGVWIGLGDNLALLRDGQLLLPATSPMLPAGTRLIGSPSGDVFTISGGDGQLGRYGQESGGGRDLTLWQKTLVPIFTRLCQACHLPAGSARIDMSTYSSWANLRTQIQVRVIDRQPSPMPPASAGNLTPEELAAVQAFTARRP